MLKPNAFRYICSLVSVKAFLSALKWVLAWGYFVKMYDTLSFLEIWRTSISLEWTHSLMWFSWKMKLFIPVVVRGFDQSIQAWLML